jgi:hypothetical protein
MSPFTPNIPRRGKNDNRMINAGGDQDSAEGLLGEVRL